MTTYSLKKLKIRAVFILNIFMTIHAINLGFVISNCLGRPLYLQTDSEVITSLNSNLSWKNIINYKNCICGNGEGTIEHTFWNWKLHNERKILLNDINKIFVSGPYSVVPLLSFKDKNNASVFHNVVNFILNKNRQI